MQTQRGIHVGVVHHFKDIVKDEKVSAWLPYKIVQHTARS